MVIINNNGRKNIICLHEQKSILMSESIYFVMNPMYRTIALINLFVLWQLPVLAQAQISNSISSKLSESQYCTDNIKAENGFFSKEQQESLVKSITVKVKGDNNGGSGTLLGKEGNNYIVITNAHVVTGVKSIELTTHDGKKYSAEIIQDLREYKKSPIDEMSLKKYDLALLRFKTNQAYCLLHIANPTNQNTPIMIAGFSAEKGQMISYDGEIQQIPDKSFKEGYQIGYNIDVEKGMSGGAIIDSLGILIGINGKGTYPISNRSYTFEDNSRPSDEEIKKMRSLSWGVPVITFLKKVNEQILAQYALEEYLPINNDTVSQSLPTGWVAELADKAKKFTVEIHTNNNNEYDNGSGIIIHEHNNVYTVLTSAHVICELEENKTKSQDDIKKCLDDSNYKIITSDKIEYEIDKNTIQVEKGVDLAILKFTSKSEKGYPVAKLADYNPKNEDFVFVAGYRGNLRDWTFSPGRIFEKEEGLGKTYASEFENGRLKRGYEFVYTNSTFKGMSGGPVLDSDGRVIAIHGAAEGAKVKDNKGDIQQLKFGYSLGIPVSTFLEIGKKLGIEIQELPIQEDSAEELDGEKTSLIEQFGIQVARDNARPEHLIERGNQLWRLGKNKEALKEFERAIDFLKSRPNNSSLISFAYFGKGLALNNSFETKAALEAFEQAVELNPEFASSWQQLSESYQSLGRYQEALNAIEKAIILQDNNPNYHSSKAFILHDLKRISEAEVAMKRATELSHLEKFRYYLGGIYGMQKKWDDALIQFTEVIRINPQKMDAHKFRGLVYKNKGEWQLALEDYNTVVKNKPEDVDVYIYLGDWYSDSKNKGKNPDFALENYNKAIELEPNNAYGYINRGNIYANRKYKLKNDDLALENYNQAIKIEENNASAYINRGILYENRGNFDLALKDYNRAIEVEPNNVYGYINRGHIYANRKYKLKNDDLALENYNQALELEENNVNAYINRGIFYENKGDFASALKDYNRAIELEANNAYSYINRGNIYANRKYKLKNDDLALENYKKAIEIEPDNVNAYLNRGFYYENKGDFDSALKDYNRAIELEPYNASGYINRGNIYANLKNKLRNNDLALENYNKALELEENNANANAYIARGVIYIRQKNWNLGFEDCKKAIQIEPDNPSSYMCLGLIYHSQEKWDLALDNYNKVLQHQSDYVAAIDNIGLIKYEQGALDAAIQQWQKSINIESKSAEPHLALAIALYTKGEKQKAYQIAEVALRLDKSFADVKVMEENLWQERLITDAQKLLSSSEIQALLSRLP